MTYELDELLVLSAASFRVGDFEAAEACRREAVERIGPAFRLVQMGDGELQKVPVEG